MRGNKSLINSMVTRILFRNALGQFSDSPNTYFSETLNAEDAIDNKDSKRRVEMTLINEMEVALAFRTV